MVKGGVASIKKSWLLHEFLGEGLCAGVVVFTLQGNLSNIQAPIDTMHNAGQLYQWGGGVAATVPCGTCGTAALLVVVNS